MCDGINKEDIVAIDGPSGVGKSTVSRKVAVSLGYAYLDTGAMYRAVGYHLKEYGVSFENEEGIAKALENLSLQLLPARKENEDVEVIANGENVSQAIRSPEMAMIASKVSAIPLVREILTEMQRSQGREGRIVAEGRDIGTVVFPRAAYKFFLDAKPEERARRRLAQLQSKGVKIEFSEVLQQILDRDEGDRSRAVAPLRKAEDAILIDTTKITPEEVVSVIIQTITRVRTGD